MSQTLRLHRGDPLPTDAETAARNAAPESADAVLAKGHPWLRFPSKLEAAFRVDTLAPRRIHLMACGVLGAVGVGTGVLNLRHLAPDVDPQAWVMLASWMACCVLSLLMAWRMPVNWRRHWQLEAVTASLALAINAIIIWVATVTLGDVGFTHVTTTVIAVIYVCIAARLRFRWALGTAVLSFAAYAIFVEGASPYQTQLVRSHINFLGLSSVFALMANYAFEHRERRTWLRHKLEQQRRTVLMDASVRLQQLAIRDPLTGMLNRRQFDTELELAWARAAFTHQPLSVLMVDVDFFKLYNDAYGHPAGDACLIQLSKALTCAAQAHGGVAARIGGEEFCLLLPACALAQAMDAGATLCDDISAARLAHCNSPVASYVTVSVGAAQARPAEGGTPLALMAQADLALYEAKASGRDRVCAAACEVAVAAPVVGAGSADGPILPLPPVPGATYAATLAGGFRRLRFPAQQEAAYLAHHANSRRKQLAVMSVLGMLIYNGYGWVNSAMFSDIDQSVLLMQLWLSVGVLLLSAVGYRRRMHPLWREGLYSVFTTAVGVFSVWVLSHSQQMSTLSYIVCLVMIPMFAGVGARQPFWFTCLPALITAIASISLFNPVGDAQAMVMMNSLFIITNITAYTLILAYTLEHGARKEWLFAQIERLQREALELTTLGLRQLSVQDALTGICNRRQFEDDLEFVWGNSLRAGRPVAMLIIDVDHFKRYNDGYGHPAGDRCLKQIAHMIHQQAQSANGMAARLGGEEFGVLLPDSGIADALQWGEALCAAVRNAGMVHRFAESGHVTVSAGAASVVPARHVDRVSLFAIADEALYQAKRAGRDRVQSLDTRDQAKVPLQNTGT
ncbi:MAG: diguanylate cyclase [Aquabacterium sp.]|nr:diguanylate cyclase [Aquabacterium sp.]